MNIETKITEPLMLDGRAVGKLLTVSSKTVMRMVADGEFPAPVKLRGQNRWPRAVVEAWVASQATATTTG